MQFASYICHALQLMSLISFQDNVTALNIANVYGHQDLVMQLAKSAYISETLTEVSVATKCTCAYVLRCGILK